MIRCYPNVGCTPLDHGQNRSQDATYCADFLAIHTGQSGHGEKVTEQFICPVNQVHIHAISDRLSTGDAVRSSKRFREINPVCQGRRKCLNPFGRPMVRKTQRLPVRSLKNGTLRESKKVQASSVDMRRRWLPKKAQFRADTTLFALRPCAFADL